MEASDVTHATEDIPVLSAPPGAIKVDVLRGAKDGHAVFRLDQPIIITIDGPAGTGKSSVARHLAARLGLDFLDTGAMYRAAALIAIQQRIPINDHGALVAAVERADIRFDWSMDPPGVLAFGETLGERIRRADVTAIVSPVAGIPGLRRLMVQRQRHIASLHPRLVTEGRDQGSVVFPDAKVKFYLDATPEERARRRAAQLSAAGMSADEPRLLREIIERDRSDMSRADGPLVCPEGAVVIDTSAMTIDRVIDELEVRVRAKAREP
jgi:cytidylate kinase